MFFKPVFGVFVVVSFLALFDRSLSTTVHTVFLRDDFSKEFELEVVKACFKFCEHIFASQSSKFPNFDLKVHLVDFSTSFKDQVRFIDGTIK